MTWCWLSVFTFQEEGFIEKDDLKKRRKFPLKVTKMLTDKFWEEGILFYIDAAGFQHKQNSYDETRSIRDIAWRLKNEGSHLHCTAKATHQGSGGRVAYFTAAIAHQKGVVLCEHYEGKINGDMFSDLIKAHFQKLSFDAGFQKAKGFFNIDVLYKTVKGKTIFGYSCSNQIQHTFQFNRL